MTLDYFDKLLKQPSLFKDESKLDIDYLPEKLPHREKELQLLSQLFLQLLKKPNSISRKILITGKTGIGKSVTVKLFCKLLKDAASKRDIIIKTVHVNCRKERTSYKALINIIRSLNENFPKRGYSPQDLLDIIVEFLEKEDIHLLIILDELNYLINNKEDLIYSLTRINDDTFNSPQRISIIGIVRNISCLHNLDKSTMSTLQKNIIFFRNYSKKEIFDILKYRISISLNSDVITNELIEQISKIVYEKGDIRYGLNIIWRSAKIAENKHLKHITSECIRLSVEDVFPFSILDCLKTMSFQKLIFLYSIIKTLQLNLKNKSYFSEIQANYKSICENIGMASKSNSQLWNYLQEMKREGILLISVQSEEIKGRRSVIEIPEISLYKLEENLLYLLKEKGVQI